MFDISFVEIIIISIVALIVLGPERLPTVARAIGYLLGRIRRYINGVKVDIHNEMRLDELKNLHASIEETVHTIEDSVKQEVDGIKSMTDESLTTTSSSFSPEVKIETDTKRDESNSSAKPASQQQASESSEQKRSTLEKDDK